MKTREKQNVLITGINGFVGVHLARELAQTGHVVYGVSREPVLNPDITDMVTKYWQAELTDLHQTQRIEWPKINNVIHLAGLAAVGASYDNPQRYMDVNTGLIKNIFEAAKIVGLHPRVISISSGAVYGKTEGPVTEDSPVSPGSPYAVSKLAAEEIVNQYRALGFENSVNIRPFNHAGPGQASGFLIPDIGSQLVARADTIRAGNLSSSRDYTDVRDVVRAYRMLVEAPALKHQVYNVCSGQSIKGEDIYTMLKDAAGMPNAQLRVDETKLRAVDEDVIVGSHQRLTDETGWQPEIPISQTIQDYVDFEKSKN